MAGLSTQRRTPHQSRIGISVRRGDVGETPERGASSVLDSNHLLNTADPGYGRGVPFWASYFSGQGSLARVTLFSYAILRILHVLH